MAARDYLFTSESVSEGHPDKVADQISDGVLDSLLKQDPRSRVACETIIKTGMVMVAGEITSSGQVAFDVLVRKVLRDIGYTDVAFGCDAETVAVLTNVTQQSPDIAQGVNENEGKFTEQGAGDQGLMFGYACDDTPELMPLPIALSHRLVERAARLRKDGTKFLRPDAKSQVTVQYEDGEPKWVHTVVLSHQHAPEIESKELENYLIANVIREVIPANYLRPETRFLINPTGRFVTGGPHADCGLTGRKIIVDTYGGYARHGGGAFSGKDPSKVDRSAAYAARYVAKNVVAAGLARRCEIQVAYAIGVAEPVSLSVDTFGTAVVGEGKIAKAIRENFSLTPRGITETLSLQRPIYAKTAAYGHFGRKPEADGSFSWERVDVAERLKKSAGL